MQTIVLIVHLLIALALVGVILLQRSEGGALGIGGGGFGGLMSGRQSANLLTRTTAVLAGVFLACTLGLAYFGNLRQAPASSGSVLESVPVTPVQQIPGSTTPPAGSAPAQSAPAPAPTPTGAGQIPAK